jgi:hypothetical protein
MIAAAKVVLNVHYYETKLFPALRMLLPTVLGVPVVSESSFFSEKNNWGKSGITFADYDDIIPACVALTSSADRRLENAQQSLNFVSSLEFAPSFNIAMGCFYHDLHAQGRPTQLS